MNGRDLRDPPPTTPLTHPVSAPSSRIRDPALVDYDKMSPSQLRGGTRSAGRFAERSTEKKLNSDRQEDLSRGGISHHGGQRNIPGGSKIQENLRPMYTQPKSARSSLRTGSPVPTTPPGSVSLSQSNSSTAPILPSFGDQYPRTPRNKLVKRSSSQRVLNGGANLHSTLRRPATSHQRSATLSKEYFDNERITTPTFHSSPLPNHLSEDNSSVDLDCSPWRPFFRRHLSGPSRSSS